MRVIAGSFKGHKLFTPKGNSIRPTSDRIREFIFSCREINVQDANVADLFCGTGSLGIEALSRGAKSVVLVDNSYAATELVKKSLEKLKMNTKAYHVYKMSVAAFLHFAARENFVFDYFFCDPSYQFEFFDNVLEQICANHLLADEGNIVYESSSRSIAPAQEKYAISRQKIIGDTQITFYRLKNE